MTFETAIRPVLVLLRALADLDRAEIDPGSPLRGPARRRAFNAKNALPSGALDRSSVVPIVARWQAHFEADFPPPEATSAPPPAVGTTYWLSSGDAHGAVLRVRLDRLPPRSAPFESFWPGDVDEGGAADDAAEQVHRRVARLCRFQPIDPLRGWHRIVPAEVEPHAWRGLRIEGRSFGAALGLMLLSRWLGAPLDPTMAVTGDLDDELRLVLPRTAGASIEAKVHAAARERACIRRIFVPPGLAPDRAPPGVEIVEAPTFEALATAFGLRLADVAPPPLSIQAWLGSLEEAEWLIRTRAAKVGVLRARLESLEGALAGVWPSSDRPAAVDGALLRLLGRLCGFAAHDLDLAAALAVHKRIDELVTTCRSAARALPLATLATVRNAQASAMIDAKRFVSARIYAAEALAAARAIQDEVEAARIAGTLARIEAHARRDRAALALLDEALEATRKSVPWEANIARCYRIALLSRLDRRDDARAALAEAREANRAAEGVSEGWRSDNELYLDYEALKLALAIGDAAEARKALAVADADLDARSRGPWPALGILVRGVDACLRAGDRASAEARFARLERRAEPHGPRFLPLVGRAAAHLVLDEPRSPDPSLIAVVQRYVDAIPDGEDSPFRAPRDACRAALASGKDLASALGKLLALEID